MNKAGSTIDKEGNIITVWECENCKSRTVYLGECVNCRKVKQWKEDNPKEAYL